MREDMNDRVLLDMDAGEAVITYGKLEAASAAAYRAWRQLILTNAPADEQDAAKVVAEITARVVARLQDQLWPRCEWFHDECDRPRVSGERFCAFHAERAAVSA